MNSKLFPLALTLLIAITSGCGGGGSAPASTAAAADSPTTSSTTTTLPPTTATATTEAANLCDTELSVVVDGAITLGQIGLVDTPALPADPLTPEYISGARRIALKAATAAERVHPIAVGSRDAAVQRSAEDVEFALNEFATAFDLIADELEAEDIDGFAEAGQRAVAALSTYFGGQNSAVVLGGIVVEQCPDLAVRFLEALEKMGISV